MSFNTLGIKTYPYIISKVTKNGKLVSDTYSSLPNRSRMKTQSTTVTMKFICSKEEK